LVSFTKTWWAMNTLACQINDCDARATALAEQLMEPLTFVGPVGCEGRNKPSLYYLPKRN